MNPPQDIVSETKKLAGRRLSVITVDQIISGGSNVLIAVMAARLLGVASFGYFGIVFLVYTLMIGAFRALISDPMLVHPLEANERRGDVIGAGCLLAVGLAGVVLVGGLGMRALNPELGDALIVLAVFAPLLILQDLGRYLAFAFQRPSFAVVLDVAWLVALVAGVAFLVATATPTLASLVGVWAGSGAVAGLLVFVQHRGGRPRFNLSWLRYTWTFSWRYLISYTCSQGSALAMLAGVGAIAGAKARGGVQGTLLLIRPYTTVQIAAVAAGVGEISRFRLRGAPLRRHAAKTTLLTAGIALLNAAVVLALPDRVGELVLGASWQATKPLLLPTCAQILMLGLLTGARVGLLGSRAIQKAVVIDVVSTVVVLVMTMSGAFLAGAAGALWLGAAGQAAMAVVWWLTFWSHAASGQPSPERRPLERHEPAAAVKSA